MKKKLLAIYASAIILGLGFVNTTGSELADPPMGGFRSEEPVTPPPTTETESTDTTIVDPIVELTDTIL